MQPTDTLKEEHRAIERMLQVLERVCGRVEDGEEINPDHLEGMLEFFKVFADKSHHGKEEALLFPAMAEAGVPVEDGPIAPFLEEHVTGREYVQGMSQTVDRYRESVLDEHTVGREYVQGMSEAVAKYRSGGDHQVLSRFAEIANDYIALLTGHIEREDNMLFPIADAHLSEEQQEELEQQFAIVDREEIGTTRQEELLELLNHLERAC
ncbi:MAG: hemerythrin domain-containing protein [Ardenticatenaceae bacterium]|nr:hemerythrin domain-containing protein [Ardenticatenaceae bacterium]